MIVRQARLTDAGRLARLHARAFGKPWSKADFESWLRREGAFSGICEENGRLVGLGVVLVAGTDAELLTLASRPGRRRRGAARRLLAFLDREAARRSLERWVLEVACNNLPALGLYRSLNFVEIGVRRGYYASGADQFDGFVLARPVGFAASPAGGHGSD